MKKLFFLVLAGLISTTTIGSTKVALANDSTVIQEDLNSIHNDNERLYLLWGVFNITTSSGTVQIRNANVSWGKFFQAHPFDQDIELSPSVINNTLVYPGMGCSIGVSGREYSLSGTEGSFEIWDLYGRHLYTIHWNCPFIGENEIKIEKFEVNSGDIIRVPRYPSINSLGYIDIDITVSGTPYSETVTE